MNKSRDVESLIVHQGTRRAGVLRRISSGAALTLDDVFVAASERPLASTLPLTTKPIEVHGVNLHPYFAGLLPEGLRLRALVRSAKTSEDDLFTLLAALGDDVVGDVWCTRPGDPPSLGEALVQVDRASDIRFHEVFERAVAGEDRSTFAGIQPKVSAGRLTVSFSSGSARKGERPADYILKLPSEDYPHLVRNEAFCMRLAGAAGLEAAHVEIVTDRDGVEGLLVERFDRERTEDATTRLAVEDLCQLRGVYPADKYRLSVADAVRTMERATAPAVESLRLLELQAFSYLIGNGDLHGKNVSLLTRRRTTRLSPSYDLVSTLPYGDRHMAMKLDGKDARLKRRDFAAFGARIGIRERAIERMLDRLTRAMRRALADGPGISSIGLDERSTKALTQEFERRLDALADR